MQQFPFDADALKIWFLKEARDLPWRKDPSPYAVWVSEIMLQQTQVAVVKEYYRRWMERFPNIESLAKASLEEVVKMWEGLGYYSRARNLHAAARFVVEKFNGSLPGERDALEQIKGLGPYTIGAILSFAFHQKAAAVDGNVIRVLTRYFALSQDVQKSATLKKIWEIAEVILPEEEPWVVVEGLIELGASVCKREAHCWECPLRSSCAAFAQGIQAELPKKGKKMQITALVRDVFVIVCEGALLVKKGTAGKVMADLYEFPYVERKGSFEGIAKLRFGVKSALFAPDPVSAQIAYSQSSMSICAETGPAQKSSNLTSKASLAIPPFPFAFSAKKIKQLPQVVHGFTRYKVTLHPSFWNASQKHDLPDYQWIDIKEIHQRPFSSGHRKILHNLELEYAHFTH